MARLPVYWSKLRRIRSAWCLRLERPIALVRFALPSAVRAFSHPLRLHQKHHADKEKSAFVFVRVAAQLNVNH